METKEVIGQAQGKKINKTTSLLLCIFMGYFGAHKFYEGKTGMGILYILTAGLFGIGWFVDIVIIALKPNPYYISMRKRNVPNSVETRAYRYKKLCPQCGGTNYHAFIDEVVIQEGKVKSRTTVNLNPLRPFTVFNHKEKVVRKPLTKQISKFVCDDCGKIFQ